MFKVLVLLALLACVSTVPAPSKNIEPLANNPVEPATSSVDSTKDDLEGSEFIWGYKFWPYYYPARIVYPAPVAYKVVYPAPVVYKVTYPAPVVYKAVVAPATVEVQTVPATPYKTVNITVDAQVT